MTEESPETPSTGSYRRLTPAEWEQVVVLWESGSVTLQDLSDRFGITKAALHDGLKKRGAVKGSRAKEFARHTEESLKTEAQRRAESIKSFRGEYQKYGDFIMKAAVIELKNLLEETPRSPETKRRIFTCIKYVAEIYNIVRDNKFHLHDLYNVQEEVDDLPEIAVTQYSNEEIEAIKSRFDVPLLTEEDDIMASAMAALEDMEAGT